MSDAENQPEEATQENTASTDSQEAIQKTYADKGLQKMSMDDYVALRRKKIKKTKSKKTMPMPLKVILAIPVLAIFCYGVIFVPYMIFQLVMAVLNGESNF